MVVATTWAQAMDMKGNRDREHQLARVVTASVVLSVLGMNRKDDLPDLGDLHPRRFLCSMTLPRLKMAKCDNKKVSENSLPHTRPRREFATQLTRYPLRSVGASPPP